MTSSRRSLLSVFICLALSLSVFAQTAPKAAAPKASNQNAAAKTSPAVAAQATTAARSSIAVPKLAYEKYKLKNGLDVILLEDHRLPLVAVNIWYHVGPANERPGLTGFAHLYEHMMFEGSRHVGEKAHFKYMEAAGASDINGTTDFDRTNYFETLPSNELEKALWLESDRMGFLLDTLDEARLANQRDVVRNERREGENAPYQLVEEGLFHTMYEKTHPYYAYVIGSHADIESAKLNDVRDFFRRYYSPSNASLAIVGDVDKVKARALVEKYFGTLPAGPPAPKITAQTKAITSERRATITDQVQLPRVYMGWITAPIYKPGDAEADLLAQILGGGKSSRLYKKLVYEKQIAQSVSVSENSLMLGSMFEITATAKPGVKPEQLEAAIDEELDAIRKTPVTAAELERARNSIESRIIRALQTLGGFGGVADRLNTYNHYLGDPGYLAQDIGRYEQATPAALQKFASAMLGKNQRAVIYGVPGEKKIDDVPQAKNEVAPTPPPADREPWRSTVPGPGPASKLNLPAPQTFKLANGLTVMLMERHNLPVIAASVYVLAGTETNPADKSGLSGFAADMLDEGTTKRSTLKIAEDADQIGASISSGSSTDAARVDVSVLSKNTDAAFDLLSDVTLHPAFDAKELDRVRKQRLTSLLQESDDPAQLAAKALYRVIYGAKHPYGYLALGTEAAIKGTTRDDLTSFYAQHYHPNQAALVVAGDITATQLKTEAEKYFGGWTGTAQAATVPPVSMSTARKIVIVDKPAAPQTQMRIGHLGPARSTPDYPQLEVMNTMLGGLFSSRINMNLREEHGYTYGAGSRFRYFRGPGPFYAAGGIRTDVTAPAVAEVFKEFDRMRTTELTAEELKMSQDFIARSLPGDFETSESTVGSTAQIFVYGLPNDFWLTLPSRVATVSAADVQRTAQKYLQPDKMAIVAVGDRAKIEPELQKLNLGPVELRDTEANLVTGNAKPAASPSQP